MRGFKFYIGTDDGDISSIDINISILPLKVRVGHI